MDGRRRPQGTVGATGATGPAGPQGPWSSLPVLFRLSTLYPPLWGRLVACAGLAGPLLGEFARLGQAGGLSYWRPTRPPQAESPAESLPHLKIEGRGMRGLI